MKLIIGSHVSYNNKSQLLGSVKEALSYRVQEIDELIDQHPDA